MAKCTPTLSYADAARVLRRIDREAEADALRRLHTGRLAACADRSSWTDVVPDDWPAQSRPAQSLPPVWPENPGLWMLDQIIARWDDNLPPDVRALAAEEADE